MQQFASGVKLPTPTAMKFTTSTINLGTSYLFADEEKIDPEPKGEPRVVVGLTGYRLYQLDKELYLIGARGAPQKVQESEQATHEGGDFNTTPTNHGAPAWDCLCGYAAFFWPTGLTQPSWSGVLAEVQAGGRTIVCEQGWRAERIALKKLWIACPIFPESGLEILRERYGIPVEVL